MPVILSLDFETSGLDVVNDRVIEVGAILFSTGQQKCLESTGFLVQSSVLITEEITKITGITQAAVDRFGYDPIDALENVLSLVSQADMIAGHNVLKFDKKVLDNWAQRQGSPVSEKLWIDTTTDLPGAKFGTLSHVAADHGFLNLFPHSALADCQTVVKLLSMYNIEEVITRAKSPTLVIRSHQDRNSNSDASKLKFRWNPERKVWWRLIKEMDLEQFSKDAPFSISIFDKQTSDEFLNL
jgi:DNA polymerase III alpha subunit (gram-positive type)